MGFAKSYEILVFGRIVAGFANGINYTVMLRFISEFAPAMLSQKA